MNLMDDAYAVLHIPTGKLVGNLVRSSRLFWTRKQDAQKAINKNTMTMTQFRKYKPGELRIVKFSFSGVML